MYCLLPVRAKTILQQPAQHPAAAVYHQLRSAAMLSQRGSMQSILSCQSRPQLSGSFLHARQSVSQKHRRPLLVSAVASPSHKHDGRPAESSDGASGQQPFTSDSVKLSSAPRAGQPGSQSSKQRTVRARASNQQSLNISSLWGN